MTHDELLIEVNRRLEVALYNGDPQSIHALRAVVELHSHTMDNHDRCIVDGQLHPCLTIQAIEQELA